MQNHRYNVKYSLQFKFIACKIFVCYSTHLSDRTFPVARPRLWNSLPSNLRQYDLTVQQFCIKDAFVWLTETPVCSAAIRMFLLTCYIYSLITQLKPITPSKRWHIPLQSAAASTATASTDADDSAILQQQTETKQLRWT